MNPKSLLMACAFACSVVPVSNAVAETASQAVADIAKKRVSESENADRTNTGAVDPIAKLDARGVVVPNAEVTLGAGLAAKIEKMPYKAGQAFKKGENLVVFDCARQQADLRGAKAALGKASSFYKSKKRLKSRGAAGGQEVREAAADVATATATVDGLREIIKLCKIAAPFDGRVVERHAETHEIPAANAPILTVVDDSALELDLIVPSTWLKWVKEGSSFVFAVDELGESYQARVARTGAKVDAVSQTIKITGLFVARPDSVLAGMSGTAKFAQPAK